MRIVVYGAGAIGSLFGALLFRAGHDVVLVGRSDHVRAIRRDGLRVEGVTEGIFPVPAVERLEPGTAGDAVLLGVKAYAVTEAARSVAQAISTPVPVLALQNGFGIESKVAAALESGRWSAAQNWIVRGINSVPATLVAAGRVRHAGQGELLLADYSQGQHAARLAELLTAADIPARVTAELGREIWRKILVNAAINPVTADHRITNGGLLENPWRQQAEQLLREAQSVASAEGFPFADAEADADLWKVVRATAENRSSMLQDLEAGRRTEIDAISGAVLELGRRHGLSLPATERIVARIHEKERIQ